MKLVEAQEKVATMFESQNIRWVVAGVFFTSLWMLC